MTDDRRPFAWREVGLVVAVQAAVLLAMAPHYGPHRDELYFVSAGERLAWGYPDQPSFTPFLARLATEVAPHHLLVLRLPGLLAAVGIVLLAVHYARLLGAGRGGQVLTAVVVAASAVIITLGHRLATASFDTLAWTAVARAGHPGDPGRAGHDCGWWPAWSRGLGSTTSTRSRSCSRASSSPVWLDPAARPELRTRWPWLAGLVAAVMWLPNLAWQAQHGWPVFDALRRHRRRVRRARAAGWA